MPQNRWPTKFAYDIYFELTECMTIGNSTKRTKMSSYKDDYANKIFTEVLHVNLQQCCGFMFGCGNDE